MTVDIRVGDEVEITYKGTVRAVHGEDKLKRCCSVELDTDFGSSYYVRTAGAGANVVVTKRVTLKVGDEAHGNDIIAADLPLGSVVYLLSSFADLQVRRVRCLSGWQQVADGSSGLGPESLYRIEFIPE